MDTQASAGRKHLLLIAYVFPPYYGIGGRRWAKHATELTKLGYTIHVICARNPFDKDSMWWEAVKQNPYIIVHQLPGRYPKALVNFAPGLLQKISYKFWITLLPLLTKGSYLDRTIFWKGVMLRKAKHLIDRHGINKVICTGGPFGTMYHATLLKKWRPDLFLLNDLRDPWTWGPNWGFPGLSAKRMAYEKSLEKMMMRDSDVVTVPVAEMYDYLAKHYPEHISKVKVIPHFYDTGELSVKQKTASGKVRLVLYGNIYQDIEHYLDKSAAFFAKHQDKFDFDIYTDKTSHLKYFEKHGAANVKTQGQMPAKQLFDRFERYDFVLLYTPLYGIHNISTKFFEIIYSRTPVVFFGEPGRASEFLESNRLGLQVNLESFEQKLLDLHAKKQSFDYNHAFDVSDYSIEKITRDIAALLG